MSWKLFKFDNWLTQFLKWLISRLRLTIDEISQNRLTHHDCNTMLNNFEDKLENWKFWNENKWFLRSSWTNFNVKINKFEMRRVSWWKYHLQWIKNPSYKTSKCLMVCDIKCRVYIS